MNSTIFTEQFYNLQNCEKLNTHKKEYYKLANKESDPLYKKYLKNARHRFLNNNKKSKLVKTNLIESLKEKIKELEGFDCDKISLSKQLTERKFSAINSCINEVDCKVKSITQAINQELMTQIMTEKSPISWETYDQLFEDISSNFSKSTGKQ